MQKSTNNPSSERRQKRRDSVRQPAILQSAEHGEITFLIRNFSPTSMYLGKFVGRALSDDQTANKIRQGDEVFVRVEIEGKPIANIAASVDRIGELGLGITFFKLQEQLDKDLKELANQQGFETGDASPLKSATRTSLLKEIRKASLEFVKRYSKQLIEVSNEALFDMAGKVGTDASQSPFFDAMGILRQHGEDIRKQYVAGLERHLDEFKQVDLFAGLDAEKSAGSELSLVDEREFEDWLAISEIDIA